MQITQTEGSGKKSTPTCYYPSSHMVWMKYTQS